MNLRNPYFNLLFTILIGFLLSCGVAESNESIINSDTKQSSKVVQDSRFKVDTVINGMNVKLILNRKDVPVGSFSDFYLKVDEKDPRNVNISTDVSEGFVSQNKEPYYYGIKAVQGVSEIKLMLFYKDEEDERIKIGDVLVPVEQKK